jgi:hypothetical protein
MASIRIDSMRTKVQNQFYRIFSVSWKCDSFMLLLRWAR